MAHSQINNVLVYARMYAVTERGVVVRQVDCSILWLQRLQSSYCPEWSLSQWQRGSRTQQIGDVVGLAKTSQAHSQQPGTEALVSNKYSNKYKEAAKFTQSQLFRLLLFTNAIVITKATLHSSGF